LNALDAMPNGGKLQIQTYRKNVSIIGIENPTQGTVENQLNYVFVEIKDSGTGITSSNLNKIFNPFFTTKSNGLGLGLSICSRLVGENGGNLDIQSEHGVGTAVTIALPAFIHS
jgi:signal transduction histidine kinase